MNEISSYIDAQKIRCLLASYQMNGYHFLYRGHSNYRFKLLSMVGRKQCINEDLLQSEKRCFDKYKEYAYSRDWKRFKLPKYNEDMFYMSIGRHLGLDCRLLDWSARLETALFFASSETKHKEENGSLWIMCYKDDINDFSASFDPFNIDKVTIIKESYLLVDNQDIYDLPLGNLRQYSQNGFSHSILQAH